MRPKPLVRLTFAPVVLAALAAALVVLPEPAEARHRPGVRPRVVVGFRTVPSFYPGYGFYASAFHPWGLYPRRIEGGLAPGVARAMGLGAIDFDVKPRKAEVWVDGEYAGTVRDLDGYPSYLWLEKGTHRIAIYKGGYQTWENDVRIVPGRRLELELRLAPGDSPPPGAAN